MRPVADERRVLCYTRAEYKRIESFRFVYIIILCYTGGASECRLKTRIDAEVFTIYNVNLHISVPIRLMLC